MKQQVNLDIMAFVEQQILPRYNAFGSGSSKTRCNWPP